jgi:hypothetical protein
MEVSSPPFDLRALRSATFPTAKHGYDRRAVDHLLLQLVDWLESAPGAADSESDLDWVDARRSRELLSAEQVAQSVVEEAREQARRILARAEREAARFQASPTTESDDLQRQLRESRQEADRLKAELAASREALTRVSELESLAAAAQQRGRQVERAAGAEIARLRRQLEEATGRPPATSLPADREPELLQFERELRLLEKELWQEARDLRQREQELLLHELKRANLLQRRLEKDLRAQPEPTGEVSSALSPDFSEQLALAEARFDRAERHIEHLVQMAESGLELAA